MRVSTLTRVAITAAILCIIAPITLPIGLVPLSLATLVLYASLYALTPAQALAALGLYLLMGCIGLPVFSGFAGGVQKLAGPTGGYLLGYGLLLWIAGAFVHPEKPYRSALGLALGTLACYAMGTAWLMMQTGLPLSAALLTAVVPFLPGDAAKIAVAVWLGKRIHHAISKL